MDMDCRKNKKSSKWGHIPFHRIGLLHKFKFFDYPLNNINQWRTKCGLKYYEYPTPYFTAKGIKCKKCEKIINYQKK